MPGVFSNSTNHFRAIAILIIVAGHSYKLGGLVFDSFWEKLIENIISGGTALFVFISGFLFHHVFYKNFSYTKFFFSKCKNILIPYTIIGIIPIVLAVTLEPKLRNYYSMFRPTSAGFLYEYVIPAGKYFWTGRFENAYWYIPFIMVTFALSPLHISFIKAPPKVKAFTVFSLLIISMLMHRPHENLHVFQSVLYFFPVYLIGISSSIYRNLIYSKLSGKESYILLGVIFLAISENFMGHSGNYHKAAFVFGGIDIIIIQKILLCFFFMVWLHRFENYQNKYINYLASTSFAVFFFHPLLIQILRRLIKSMGFSINESWIVYLFWVLVLTAACVGLAKLVKNITPTYSRYLIGY
jgi:hypothetical protein